MANDPTTAFKPRRVLHPGEVVVDYLEENDWTQRDLARRSGLTPKTISEICNGKASITPATALVFEKVFQRPAHFWINLQSQYDEAEARRLAEDKAEKWKPWAQKFGLSEWADWAKRFPLREMKKYQWIQPNQETSEVNALLNFLGVSSPDSWNEVWEASRVSYRQTRGINKRHEAITVWVRATELLAADIPVADFDERLLRGFIDQLRQLTRRRVPEAVDVVQSLCASAGVAVVWVPELQNTGISGCARWLTSRKALIALTLRYKTDDQMWFTFFHELGHVLLHRKRLDFILDNAEDNLLDRVVDPQVQREEEEANRFASDTLVPPSSLSAFIAKKDLSSGSIYKFAEDIGVGPGIVVGRLQHEGILGPAQGNEFKQKLAWKLPAD